MDLWFKNDIGLSWRVKWGLKNTKGIGREGKGSEMLGGFSEGSQPVGEGAVGHKGRELYEHSPSLNTPLIEKKKTIS